MEYVLDYLINEKYKVGNINSYSYICSISGNIWASGCVCLPIGSYRLFLPNRQRADSFSCHVADSHVIMFLGVG